MFNALIQFTWPVLKPIFALCGIMLFIGLAFGLLIAG